MSRHERDTIDARAQAELDAIDAALRGEALDGQHAQLAALTSSLRATRPRPRAAFVGGLDARAAHGFSRDRRFARLRPSAIMRHPGFALAAVIAAIAIAAPFTMSGRGGGSSSSPATSGAPPHPGAEAASPSPKAPASSAAGVSAGAENATRPSSPSAGAHAASAPTTRQVEQTASLDVGVEPTSIQSTAQRVFTLASAFHGYVQQSNVSSANGEQGGASFELRLPSSNLTAAMAALAHLGHVRSENETSNDVTEEHASLERALGDARAERASLLTQLSHASNPESAEALKARLNAVEARIAQLAGSLRALDARADFTNIAFSLTPERQGGAAAGDLTPGGALHDAGQILNAGLAVLVLVVAVLLPLGVIAGAALIGLGGARRRVREQALDAG
jgi:hypothetical protein